jgi:hypothetical protein
MLFNAKHAAALHDQFVSATIRLNQARLSRNAIILPEVAAFPVGNCLPQ